LKNFALEIKKKIKNNVVKYKLQKIKINKSTMVRLVNSPAFSFPGERGIFQALPRGSPGNWEI
jgi:hypothetical protein